MARAASTAAILKALDAAPEKVLAHHELRRSVKLSPRGYRTVFDRMESDRLVGRTDDGKATITFGGLRELTAGF